MKVTNQRDITINPEKENYKDRWMRKHQKHQHHDDVPPDEEVKSRHGRPRFAEPEEDDFDV